MSHDRTAKVPRVVALRSLVLSIALLCGCSSVRSDVEFARSFIIGLKNADPGIEAEMAPTLLSMAGSWQVVDASIKQTLPKAPIDSIIFVSREINSSMPATVRVIKLRVFGGTEFSLADVFLETAKNGKPLVNTIRVQGPSPLP
jgi:hypothetical protein